MLFLMEILCVGVSFIISIYRFTPASIRLNLYLYLYRIALTYSTRLATFITIDLNHSQQQQYPAIINVNSIPHNYFPAKYSNLPPKISKS